MILIEKEYDSLDGCHYVLVRTYFTCCKERILFRKIREGEYFNCETNEAAPAGWNRQIMNAIENKQWLPDYLR